MQLADTPTRRPSSAADSLKTQRLVLRPWQPTLDARHAFDIYGDIRVIQQIGERSPDSNIRHVQARLQRYVNLCDKNGRRSGLGSWAVVQKDIGRVIGHVMLVPMPDIAEVRYAHVAEPIEDGLDTHYIEIGWHFRPASWGFGYATEAALGIAQHAFEALNVPLLLAVTNAENLRSVGVMRRLGMKADGVTTRCYGGKPLLLYRLTQPDLMEAKARWDSELAFIQALDNIEE